MQATLDDLNATDRAGFVEMLGEIFEHSPWVAERVAGARPFVCLAALFAAMQAAVRDSGAETQLALIEAHPDLAGKAALAGTLTADSNAEQSSAGLDRLSEDEFAAFHRMNEAYHDKFGIPFIVCVRRHTKGSIMRAFAHRLANDFVSERNAALAEIFRIAALRLDQRVSGPDRLPVHGRLSTHVLDTHGGLPAANVTVELLELDANGTSRLIERTATNVDGRTDRPLIGGRPVPIGEYELRFSMGDHFARRGLALPSPAFLNVVPLRFCVAEPEGHYHIPLLVSPWSYTTYRGS